jgi:hypothetical protein
METKSRGRRRTTSWNQLLRLLKDGMIHDFVAPPRGLRKIEVSHINKGSSPLAVLMLSFTGIFQ